jgi:biotin carboxylase
MQSEIQERDIGTRKPRILVIASGAYDYQTLEKKQFRDNFQFFFEPITTAPADILDFIAAIKEKYQAQNLDGVLGTHDGPGSTVAAILAAELGLHGLPPHATFVCEHKYYSRLAQQSIIPSAVPEFQVLPVRNLKRKDVKLSFPFFVKPVKSAFSILARPVTDYESLKAFLPKVRAWLDDVIPAFNTLLKQYSDLELDARMLIAEELLDGVQVTVEGFSWRGAVTVMGITDSIMYPGKSSFERFEYPSRLPAAVQRRMERIASDLVAGIGVDYSMFNIEMFYNAANEAIHVIEINPRMSYQFADMFEKVDGSNSYATQLQLCMGEKPDFVKGAGQFGVAASFVLRLFENQQVTRVPTEQELHAIRQLYPDALIVIKVEEGTVLSDLSQDEQSYRYAIVNLGGHDWQDLQVRFRDLNRDRKSVV